LIIEIDGGQHAEEGFFIQDTARTVWLNGQGFRVIRFWNNEILHNLEGVLIKIQEAMDNQAPSPSYSSPIEGEESGRVQNRYTSNKLNQGHG